MDIDHIPMDFRLQLLGLAGANLFASAFVESVLVDYLVFHRLKNSSIYRKLDSQRPVYERLRVETDGIGWLRLAADQPGLGGSSSPESPSGEPQPAVAATSLSAPISADFPLSHHGSTARLISSQPLASA